jgi:RimJ/RimL family protein N-acetyltransferase
VAKSIPLSRSCYKELFNLVKLAESYKGYEGYDQFCQSMDSRRGFTYWKDDVLVGSIQFDNFYPGNSVMIHAVFHPLHRSEMNRKALREVFRFAFNALRVHRVNTYSVIGITDDVVKFILGIGFQEEGILREAAELPSGRYDLVLYSMLREDCKWL